jgi:cytochrome b561
MGLKSTSTRYGSVAIAIHWVSALAIVGLLVSGTIMAGAGVGEANKGTILPVHATVGALVFLLTLLRLAWWAWGDRRPEPVSGQPRVQAMAARIVHGLLYAGIVVLGASGIATLVLSGAIPALLSGAPLPDFSSLLPRVTHGLVSKAMIALLVAHVGAALFHQFIRRDRLLARMGLGRA